MAISEELRLVITAQTGDAIRQLDQVKTRAQSIEDVSKRMVTAGRRMSLFVTAPLVAAGGAAVKFAADIEKQAVAFETLLGNADEARKLFDDIKEFSAATPFQLPDLTTAAQRLLAFGTSADVVIEKMRHLGDAAQGDSERLNRLVDAYGKVQAKGKATLEELNRFTEAGVPIFAELQEALKMTKEELFDYITAGKLGFEEVDEALTRLTTGQGQFAGMLEKQSQTLSGLFSTLKDNLMLAGAGLVQELVPALKTAAERLTELLRKFNDMDPATKGMILRIAGIVAAIGPLLIVGGKLMTGIMALIPVIKAFGAALMWLNANPIGLIIAGVAALAAGIYLLIKNWDEVKAFLISAGQKILEWFKDHWDELLIILTGPIGLAVVQIVKHWDDIKMAFQKAWEFIKNIVDRIKEELSERLAAVTEPVKKVAEGIKGAFNWLKDELVGNSVIPDMVDAILDEIARLNAGVAMTKDSVESLARQMVDAIRPFTDAFGLMIQDAEAGWEAFKSAAKDALASVLEMLAEKAFAEALAKLPEILAGNPIAALQAAAWTAAGTAALAAAGAIRAMGEGGVVTKPTLALVGEKGPEAVIPLSRGKGMGPTVVVNVHGSVMEEEGLARKITEIQKRYSRGY